MILEVHRLVFVIRKMMKEEIELLLTLISFPFERCDEIIFPQIANFGWNNDKVSSEQENINRS